MLAEAGNISCAFNSTVYEDTMQYVPELVKWGQENIDKVQVMVFILYRAVNNQQVDFYLGPKKIDMGELVYNEEVEERTDIQADEIVEIIRTKYPDFDPCAYLNGSEKPDSFKWLLTGRLGTKGKIYGYMGKKSMEIIQTMHHVLFDKYLAYSAPFDKGLRKTFANFFKNPLNIFKRLHYQSVMIIQPVDFLEDGRQNMCDGCPDITVWNGKLVWSCRMEEQLKYGHNIRSYPKNFMN